MTAIKTKQYVGGRTLAEYGGLSEDLRDVADDLAGLQPTSTSYVDLAQNNSIFTGLVGIAPTTPSSQITGAGNTDWNVDITTGSCIVNSVEGTFAAQADFDMHSGSQLLTNGQSVYAWIVAAESGGTVTQTKVVGTPATTGSQTIPTDADITTGVGHANWIKLTLCLLNRTGDTTVTQSQSNIYRESYNGPATSNLVNAIRTNMNSAGGYTLLTTKG